MRADRSRLVADADAPSALERAAARAAREREVSTSKQELKRLGVVPTPHALVRFALGRVQHALHADLGLEEGLASADIEIVDPAVGTGNWLSTLLSLLSEAEAAPGPARILGLDTDPQALAAARSLLTPAAQRWRGELALREANTLALPDVWSAHARVRVVVGNPPWGARSANRGLALSDAWLREFHHDPQGVPLHERRAGVLSDDYVRFFRWALQQAREAPHGAVVCLVTNASYLDGPVHRGMRGALLHAFDRIEVVDLGGNSLRGAGGARDQPLFPVRVGAALTLAVRRRQTRPSARISFAALRGDRVEKQRALAAGALDWRTFAPAAPGFEFRPLARAASAPVTGFALHEAFLFHAEGVQTNRDELATASDSQVLLARLQRIAHGLLTLPASGHFSPELARARIAGALDGPHEALIGQLAYRPFELRAYCKLTPLCHRPRPQLAQAVARSSLCLLSTRKQLGADGWNMFAPVAALAESSFLSTRSACRTRVFPSHAADGSSNLSHPVAERIAERIGRLPHAEEVVAYAAGVLGSPRFRREYAADLARDYARLPWPHAAAAFAASVAAGQRFAALLRLDDQAVGALERASNALFVRGATELGAEVPRRALRWLSPHLLELGGTAQIGASSGSSLTACVGQQRIVESAWRGAGPATITAVLAACARALMWAEAEQAADDAYQLASCVGSSAKPIADPD
ncbi:MAG TPA: type ISP restriction/modification enzyme [Polyangiales bacterium]